MHDPFNLLTRVKVLWWKYLRFYYRRLPFVWYVVGIFMGWLLCSEWNVYINTGVWTNFPWE